MSYQIDLIVGGESHKVGELFSPLKLELEAYPEPKILTRSELRPLIRLYGTTTAVARRLGCSQQFVSDRAKLKGKGKGKVSVL